MQQDERREFILRCVAFVGIALLFKLWLTSGIRTVPVYAPHDETNFLEHAKSIADGKWFGAYDVYTLIKQPFFPMYLAVISLLRLPLSVAHVFLDALAATVACAALRPLVRDPIRAGALFLVLFLNPFSYDALAWMSMRSQVAPDLALMSIALAGALYLRRHETARQRLPWCIGLGITFAAFWLTREEAIWLVPGIAAILGIAILSLYFEGRDRAGRFAALLLVPVAITALSVAAVMLVNQRAYGWPVTNENESVEFVSAYNSLTRIDVPKSPFNQIPITARALAYRVSPAARELRDGFESKSGLRWHGMSPAPCDGIADEAACRVHDVGASFIIWALREAVADAGHYRSGGDARRFYQTLADQIDAACAARTIPCRTKGRTIFPPITPVEIPVLAAHFANAVGQLAGFRTLSFAKLEIGTPDATLVRDYLQVAGTVDDTATDVPAAQDARMQAIVELGKTYRLLVPVALILSFGLAAFRCVRVVARKRFRHGVEHLVFFCACTASVATLLAVLAALDALSFPTMNSEYLGQLVPTLLCAAVVCGFIECASALRFLRRRMNVENPGALRRATGMASGD